MSRISIEQVAIELSETIAQRSEDPLRKVGAVALSHENRVIAMAYNGLMPGFTPPPGFWDPINRIERRKVMLHAEMNLCSLFKRGDAKAVIITHAPCTYCMLLLMAHGVREIYYANDYETDPGAVDVANFYGFKLVKVDRLNTIFGEVTCCAL